MNHPTAGLRSKAGMSSPRLARPLGLRVHGLRQRRERGLPVLAGPADDRALGRAGPGRGRGQRCRAAPRLRRRLPHAEQPDQRLHQPADPVDRSAHAATAAGRDRADLARNRLETMATFDLPRRAVAECLGTWLLVATVVGSGIMAERLAGGNVAVALLGNTIATGAILVVLIADPGADLGRAFQSGGVVDLRDRGRAAGRVAPGLCRGPARRRDRRHADRASDVRSAAAAGIGACARRRRTSVLGSRGDLRIDRDHSRLPQIPAQPDPWRGRVVCHGRLLVHRVDLFRQPRGRHCAQPDRYLCRHPANRRAVVHRCGDRRRDPSRAAVSLAAARNRQIRR